MNVLLWVCQGLLAFILLPQGVAGVRWAIGRWRNPLAARLADRHFGGVSGVVPTGFVLCDALVSVLVAVGVIVPWLTGWYPIITPIAAAALVVFNVIQRATTWGRMHPANLLVTGVLASVIAIGRFSEL